MAVESNISPLLTGFTCTLFFSFLPWTCLVASNYQTGCCERGRQISVCISAGDGNLAVHLDAGCVYPKLHFATCLIRGFIKKKK
jgi:hypothetical protein